MICSQCFLTDSFPWVMYTGDDRRERRRRDRERENKKRREREQRDENFKGKKRRDDEFDEDWENYRE